MIKKTFFGPKKEQPDVIILSPHDGDHKDFLTRHPEITELFKDDLKLFEDYLNLERDIGATQIALKIGENIHEIRPELGILFLEVTQIPRGIIDCNRTASSSPERAVRNIFSFTQYPELYAKLKALHEQALLKIEESFQALSPKGLFLDVHTMNQHCPKERMEIAPDNMFKYLENYTHPDCCGPQRAINIITARANEPALSHPALTTALDENFDSVGRPLSHNLPYMLHTWTMLNHYMQSKPGQGLGIDIPIHEIASKCCNINPQIDPKKIQKLASLVAQAMAICGL